MPRIEESIQNTANKIIDNAALELRRTVLYSSTSLDSPANTVLLNQADIIDNKLVSKVSIDFLGEKLSG